MEFREETTKGNIGAGGRDHLNIHVPGRPGTFTSFSVPPEWGWGAGTRVGGWNTGGGGVGTRGLKH